MEDFHHYMHFKGTGGMEGLICVDMNLFVCLQIVDGNRDGLIPELCNIGFKWSHGRNCTACHSPEGHRDDVREQSDQRISRRVAARPFVAPRVTIMIYFRSLRSQPCSLL